LEIAMKTRVLAVVSVAVMTVVSIAAWTVQEPVDAVVNAKIRDEGLNRSQVAPIFTMLVDTIGSRLTASPEHKRAAEFMRDTATKYGLSNARLEPFEFG
jgi:carboxypeptidase Q